MTLKASRPLFHLQSLIFSALAIFIVSLSCVALAQAQTESIIYSFGSNGDGLEPASPMVSDAVGSLYGTTSSGGSSFNGVVFKLSKGTGGWTETILYNFNGGRDGSQPGGVISDGTNLYGTTSRGGVYGIGTIYKLTPSASGPWKKTVLFNFSPGAGGVPPYPFFSSSLTMDGGGNLYGTTLFGVKHPQGGTIYRLSPKSPGGWTHTVLYEFSGGADGQFPGDRKLVLDSKGNVYGATTNGGTYGAGVIFMLSPTATGPWTETILHTFTGGKDGAEPNGSLIIGKDGSLYGMTNSGGSAKCYPGCGVVFKLTPNASGKWLEQQVFTFQNGETPYGGLIFDPTGNLYGTTSGGGSVGSGTVFKLTPSSTGPWTETVLHLFAGPPGDGQLPLAGLLRDDSGNLFGTTFLGGAHFTGAAFEITP